MAFRMSRAGGAKRPPINPRHARRFRFAGTDAMIPCCLEKPRRTDPEAVPKPTQVGWYKHTKARERNLVKELGTQAP